MKKKDSEKISTQELAAGCILLYELLPDKFTFREAVRKASLGILDEGSLLTMLTILEHCGALTCLRDLEGEVSCGMFIFVGNNLLNLLRI